MPNLHKGLLQS